MMLSAANIMRYWWQIKISMQHWLNNSDRGGKLLREEPVAVPLCPSHLTCNDLVYVWLNLTSCLLQNLKIPKSQSSKHGHTRKHTHAHTRCMKWSFFPSIPVGQTWKWRMITAYSTLTTKFCMFEIYNEKLTVKLIMFIVHITNRMSSIKKIIKGIRLSMADWMQFMCNNYTTMTWS
jgi:hypothetical protein